METIVAARNWKSAGVGFAVALAIIVAVEMVSLRLGTSVKADISQLARDAERSTFLIGDIGHELARLQMNVAAILSKEQPSLGESRARFEDVDGELRQRLSELTGHLSADEREVWRMVEPEIAALRSSLGGVLDLLEGAHRPQAHAALDGLASQTLRCFDSLQSFLEFNQIETHKQLDSAHALLGRTRTLHQFVAALLFVGTAAAGIAAMWIIRRKDAELDSYLRGVERERQHLVAFAGRIAYDLPIYFTSLRSAGVHTGAVAGLDP